ncbi:hypothetical protein B0H14DRAFT_3719641 [Mycena olivaceomarginata]|nr:hypothetical protein B0H14DRAFT_3719641 [Mycena olivaceomarginata]
MKAIDHFGDGSFYLLDTPGHFTGHMSALARVTPSSFIVLGGDNAPPRRTIPPNRLHSRTPSPVQETSSPTHGARFRPTSSGPRRPPPARSTSPRARSLSSPCPTSPVPSTRDPVATLTVDKLAAFDADADFLTIITHDQSIQSILPYFPASLSTWQADGLKAKTAWQFVDPANPAFLFSPVQECEFE